MNCQAQRENWTFPKQTECHDMLWSNLEPMSSICESSVRDRYARFLNTRRNIKKKSGFASLRATSPVLRSPLIPYFRSTKNKLVLDVTRSDRVAMSRVQASLKLQRNWAQRAYFDALCPPQSTFVSKAYNRCKHFTRN